jgi:hypothetical protein
MLIFGYTVLIMKNSSASKPKQTIKKNKQTGLKSMPRMSRLAIITFGLLFAVIGTYLLLFTNAGKPNQTAAVTLTLAPSSQRLQVGSEIGLAVKLNTNGQAVNSVQADLSYPTDKLEFVRIDTLNSAFGVSAPSSGGSGAVSIVRASTTPINSGDVLVATVYFKPKASGRKVAVRFADSSVVLRTPDSVNILQRKIDGSYTIQ